MKAIVHLLHGVLLLLLLSHVANAYPRKLATRGKGPTPRPITPDYGIHALNRSSFPPGFIFGLGSAAYQIEGAWNVDGKGPNEWDNFTHTYPERIADRSNGDNATNSYYLYKEDVRLLKDMNADAYRFSISWSRVLPSGKVNGGKGINQKGIDYYNKLINETIAKGLKPSVTMFHFDLPQALQDEYGGLLNQTHFVKDFHDYADLLFRTFGDRVKHWVTINEPYTVVTLAYDSGNFPPNRCSTWLNSNCKGGNSATEPYIVAHNFLLAHADVVQLYRTQYKEKQKGTIGIVLSGTWPRPNNSSNPADHKAALRYIDYTLGWFLSPVTFGYYPQSMRDYVAGRLPNFTPEQAAIMRGSIDFVGFNYYTATFVTDLNLPPWFPNSSSLDIRVGTNNTNSEGMLAGEKLGISWQYSYPKGIWYYLHHIKRNYNDPIIYITENGASEKDSPNLPLEVVLKDYFRIKYHFQHLAFVKEAIDNGVKVKGYLGWSLADNFEWLEGYTIRFGIVYVNFTTFERYPKLSAQWYKRFLLG